MSDKAQNLRSQPTANPAALIEKVRELVLAYGWNATTYQIINPGILHWFSAQNDAVIGYVEYHKVRVVASAPVCALERLPAVLEEFERDSSQHKCSVCYFGAERRLTAALAHSPHHALIQIGAQPSWHPAQLVTIFATHPSLRAQLHRAKNKAVTVEEWLPQQAERHPELKRCLREWLATRGLPTMHFLVEPDTLERLFDRRIFVAKRHEKVIGFLVASPVTQRQGWLIEQTVRGKNAVNGTIELLLATTAQAIAKSDSQYLTLGLAPLSESGAINLPTPFWLQLLLKHARAHGRRFYNFAGLETFKAKFQPTTWEPVFAISNEAIFSPRTLYAIAAAFAKGSPLLLLSQALGRAVKTEIKTLLQ